MSKSPQSKFLQASLRPWGLLTAAGAVVSAATVFGFLGRFSWFLDLFAHFRVQYLVGLGGLGLLLLILKHRKAAAVFIAFAGINLAVILPLYFGGRAAPPERSHTLRAMLLNVNKSFGDAERVMRVIEEFDPDIVVLEEISSQWMHDLAGLTKSHPYSCVQPREDNFGIGLFSKFPLEEGEIVYIGDAEVPSIVAVLDTGRRKLAIIATHPLPPGGASYSRWRNDQLDKIPDHVPSSLPVLLLGDLNTTPWSYHFKRLLKRSGLRDSSRGHGIQPTWPSYSPVLSIPIDHCLHSPDILIIERRIGPAVGSDHYPVIVDFVITPKRSGNQPTNTSTSWGGKAMDIQTLTGFFMWCTILNGGLLVLSSLICTLARDWVYQMHSKWFPMPRETFNVAIYSFIGLFKIAFISLNVVPYVALLIVG